MSSALFDRQFFNNLGLQYDTADQGSTSANSREQDVHEFIVVRIASLDPGTWICSSTALNNHTCAGMIDIQAELGVNQPSGVVEEIHGYQ